MKNIATNNEIRNNYALQEELIAKGNRLHTEAIQQALFSFPKEIAQNIGKLFGGSEIGAYPAKQ